MPESIFNLWQIRVTTQFNNLSVYLFSISNFKPLEKYAYYRRKKYFQYK